MNQYGIEQLVKLPNLLIELERCSKQEVDNHKFNKHNIRFIKEVKNIKYYPDIMGQKIIYIHLPKGEIQINLSKKHYRYAETVGGGV